MHQKGELGAHKGVTPEEKLPLELSIKKCRIRCRAVAEGYLV